MTTEAPRIGIGPRVRKSPFFEATRRWGCRAYSIYNHMYMPLYFDSVEGDFEKLSTAVTVWDVGCERQLEITGADAARFVQYLIPRDLSRCTPGACRYVVMTDDRGGVLNDPILIKRSENHYWLSLSDSDILLWAKGLAVAGGFDVGLSEPDVSPLAIQGPRSKALLHDLFGGALDDLRLFRSRAIELDGIPLVVSRTGWSGEEGYELFLCDGARGDELWERVMAAGRPHGAAPAAPNAISRIEAGLISYGADATVHDNPFELGLDWLLDLDRSIDFVGRDALRRLAADGPARRLVGAEIAGEPIPANEHAWPVLAENGQWIGRVTSAIHSPRLGKNLAFAMLAIDWTEPGSAFTVETAAGPRAGTTAALPFHVAREPSHWSTT